MIAIWKQKSDPDFKMKNADRFWSENRWSIFVRKSVSDFAFRLNLYSGNHFSIADRFQNEKRDPILIRKSLIDSGMKIADRFFRNGFWSGSGSRLRFENRIPVRKLLFVIFFWERWSKPERPAHTRELIRLVLGKGGLSPWENPWKYSDKSEPAMGAVVPCFPSPLDLGGNKT